MIFESLKPDNREMEFKHYPLLIGNFKTKLKTTGHYFFVEPHRSEK